MTHQETCSQLEAEEKKYLPNNKFVEIKDFKFATEPFWHQKVSFNFARALPQSALFLEQGLGKAKLLIDLATWRFRKNQIKRILVVCPNSVVGQWLEELKKHGHNDFNKVIALTGSKEKRTKELIKFAQDDTVGWIITNYDSLRALSETLLKLQRQKIKCFDMIGLDESSKIKHYQSQRSKLSWRLGLTVQYRNILTGTPITQSAEDIFGQYRFLKCEVFGIYATPFRANYLIMGGFESRQVIGYKNITAMLKKVYSLAIRFTKDRCLDLPEKVYEVRQAQMDPEISKQYRHLERECIAEFAGKKIAAPMVLTKMSKLSQITGGFIYEQGLDGERIKTHAFKSNPKLEALGEILEESSQKTIIWCRFVQEIKDIRDYLYKEKINFVSVSGDVSPSDRTEAIKDFQEDPTCRVFVGQVSTAGFGITLTAASLVIYFSNSYSLEDRLQSEDRCHRIGQKNKVTYIDLVSVTSDGRKTIDHDILSIIKSKAAFANEVSLALMQQMVFRQQEAVEPEINKEAEREDIMEAEEEFSA